jgi:hypothetical protein
MLTRRHFLHTAGFGVGGLALSRLPARSRRITAVTTSGALPNRSRARRY